MSDTLTLPDRLRQLADSCGSHRPLLAEAFDSAADAINRLRAAIRKHRDEKGDDRCWRDDYELYAALDEPIPESACQLDEPCVMRANCERFIISRHDPSKPYLSPQREIERLRGELETIYRYYISELKTVHDDTIYTFKKKDGWERLVKSKTWDEAVAAWRREVGLENASEETKGSADTN